MAFIFRHTGWEFSNQRATGWQDDGMVMANTVEAWQLS